MELFLKVLTQWLVIGSDRTCFSYLTYVLGIILSYLWDALQLRQLSLSSSQDDGSML